MKLQTLFKACSELAREKGKKSPTYMVEVDGVEISPKTLFKELKNLENWCYKGDIEVERVTRCKNCVHYKKFKRKSSKNPYEHSIFCACELDKIKREPEFFCANGREKK